MVTPEQFNEIIDYIAENKIAKKNMSSWNPTAKVTKTRNQEYIDFGESLKRLTPLSNTGATAALGAVGNMASNLAGKLPSGLGSLFGKK